MSNKKQEKQFQGLVQGLNQSSSKPTPTPTPKQKAPVPEPVNTVPDAPTEIVKMTAYLPKPLYKRVRIGIASQDERLSFSQLMVDLLTEWADKQK